MASKGKATAWYKTDHITCSSCGEPGYYPISWEWWQKHTGALHTLKYWLKRKFKSTNKGESK